MSLKAGAGMLYEGMLSLKLEAAVALPAPNQLLTFNEANDVLLNNLLMIEEKYEHDDNDEVMQELRRQDIKLRMMMDLLGMLLLQNQLLPPVVHVRFSGEEFCVPATGLAYAAGSFVQCSLFIDPALPKPLTLFATVQGLAEDTAGDGSKQQWVEFAFTGLSQSVQDNIEKFIFRHHRKLVAQQRRQTSGTSA